MTGRSDRNELADTKKVKNAVPGATVNDAVMALVGGGLRHYLNDADELPTDSLVALMPISLREGDSDGLGNKLTCTTFLLGTDIDDPIERVRRLHEMAAKKKAVQNGENARRLVQIAEAVPAALSGLAGRLAAQLDLPNRVSAMNITVTNVPGPGTPIYMTGAKLVDIYGFALAANGLGLVNMVSSYAGSLTIGFQCGVAMMPDPERYVACPRRSMAELVSATALTNRNGSAQGCGPQGCFWGPIGYPVGADDSPRLQTGCSTWFASKTCTTLSTAIFTPPGARRRAAAVISRRWP